jgi:DNA-directed RNA polymerase sigma subunit (sigma70/sigma32)
LERFNNPPHDSKVVNPHEAEDISQGLTLEEVAHLTRWSLSTVRRIEANALAKLRNGCEAADITHDDLKRYLRRVMLDLGE